MAVSFTTWLTPRLAPLPLSSRLQTSDVPILCSPLRHRFLQPFWLLLVGWDSLPCSIHQLNLDHAAVAACNNACILKVCLILHTDKTDLRGASGKMGVVMHPNEICSVRSPDRRPGLSIAGRIVREECHKQTGTWELHSCPDGIVALNPVRRLHGCGTSVY